MEHQTFLQIVEQSDCKLFLEWYETASVKVNFAYLIRVCISIETNLTNILIICSPFMVFVYIRRTQLSKKPLTDYLRNSSMEFGQFSPNGFWRMTKFSKQIHPMKIKH